MWSGVLLVRAERYANEARIAKVMALRLRCTRREKSQIQKDSRSPRVFLFYSFSGGASLS